MQEAKMQDWRECCIAIVAVFCVHMGAVALLYTAMSGICGDQYEAFWCMPTHVVAVVLVPDYVGHGDGL